MIGISEARPKGDRRAMAPRMVVLYGAIALTTLAVVRVITGAGDLTSRGTFSAALQVSVPIGLAGLGAVYAERAGIINIGLEGMMILGTWFGAWAGWQYGPWWGVVAGLLGGAIGGLLHAAATVTFGVDHIISGVAINILAGGVARFLSVTTYDVGSGGGATQSPQVSGRIGVFDAPFLAGGPLLGWDTPDMFGWLERRRWFLVSDAAGLLRGVTGNVNWVTVIAVALVPLSVYVLWRTAFGLRLRSVGEHPVAAESLGVPVYTMKYIAVVISGAFAGLAGAFIVIVQSGIYREGQTGGRGFIGLATMIFGNWRPTGVAAGAGLFGFADALQLRSRPAVHGMLLFVSFVAFLFAVRSAYRRRAVPAVLLAVIGGLMLLWYTSTDSVPQQFIGFTPHLTTLVVLAFAAQRLRPPAADGAHYRKGEAL